MREDSWRMGPKPGVGGWSERKRSHRSLVRGREQQLLQPGRDINRTEDGGAGGQLLRFRSGGMAEREVSWPEARAEGRGPGRYRRQCPHP